MNVSELARRAGVAPGTIRFYERAGVLPSAARQANGYRRYEEPDLCRLRVLVSLRARRIPVGETSCCCDPDCPCDCCK